MLKAIPETNLCEFDPVYIGQNQWHRTCPNRPVRRAGAWDLCHEHHIECGYTEAEWEKAVEVTEATSRRAVL